MTLVLDASIALAWAFDRVRTEEIDLANAALRALATESAVVPPIWHSEVSNALLVGEKRKIISEKKTADYLVMLSQLQIQTDEAPADARRETVMTLARRYFLTAYDATYLDLALRRGAALASFDSALVAAMRRAGGSVFGDQTRI